MPFPPKQVFIDYLNLYYSVRAEDRTSWGTFLKSGVETVASYVTGSGPVVKQLDSNLTQMEAAISASEDFDDWFRLIFTLRKTAEVCQNAKRLNGISLSCLVLHGVASLILREMHNFPDFQSKLQAEIDTRITRINDLKKLKKTSLTTKNGQSVTDYNTEITAKIEELAQLSEIIFIEKASKYKLFSYLPVRSPVDIITFTKGKGNHTGLIELQLNFCEWLYANTFQNTKKHIGFDQFLTEAAESYRRFIDQQEKAKQRATNVEAAAAAASSDQANKGDAAVTHNTVDSGADIANSSSTTASLSHTSLLSSYSPPHGPGLFSPATPVSKRGKGSNRNPVNEDITANAASAAATPSSRH